VTEDENVPISDLSLVNSSDPMRVSLAFGVNFDNKSMNKYNKQYGACDRK
jgi:hypothetical protein